MSGDARQALADGKIPRCLVRRLGEFFGPPKYMDKYRVEVMNDLRL